MCDRRDLICFYRKSDFVLIFDSSTFFDSRFEEREVFRIEFEEGDVVADLILDGPYRRIRALMCEVGVDFRRCDNFVYIV